MQTIERFGCDVQRRDEPERQFRAGEIVVDRLRDAADRNAALVKLVGDRQRAFAAKHDEGVDTEDLHVGDRFLVYGLDAHLDALSRSTKQPRLRVPRIVPPRGNNPRTSEAES